MFVGQDDGLFPFSIDLAKHLIRRAEKLQLRTIVARRAEFLWPVPSERTTIVRYRFPFSRGCSIRKITPNAWAAILSLRSYHFLPQMYTNSLWKRSLIEEVRALQSGRLFSCHPQDANLAALAVRREKRFLFSKIPIGWVGSSVKSVGAATAQAASTAHVSGEIEETATTYGNSIKNSGIPYPDWAGPFGLAENSIYFWQALVRTRTCGQIGMDALLSHAAGKALIFSFAFARNSLTQISPRRTEGFKSLCRFNGIPFQLVVIMSLPIRLLFVIGLQAKRAISSCRPRSPKWERFKEADLTKVLPRLNHIAAERLGSGAYK